MHASFRQHSMFSHNGSGKLLTAVILLLAIPLSVHADSLVNNEDAAPLGLERVWFAQARVDVTRHRVTNWVLYKNNLLAATDGGLVQSFNAETGETLWTTQAGPLNQTAFGPAACQDYVAIVSGASLYTLDRANGRLLWSKTLGSAPAAAPALSDTNAYVPFLNGRIECYTLAEHKTPTWYFQSVGRIFYPPTVSGQLVTWPTSRGYLYVGQSSAPHVRYRIQTNSTAIAPPTETPELLFVAVQDGNIHCFELLSGNEKWRYSMGFPATGRPGIVGERLYVASSEPMLHAVEAVSGNHLWSIPEVTQFAAQGANHVYGLNDLGQLVIFNKETGQYIGSLPGLGYQAVFNEQSDRIYLTDNRGLVQCLRELGAVEPTIYRQSPLEDLKEKPASEETPAQAEPPATDEQLPAEPAVTDQEASPFTVEGGNEDNPFGF